MLFGGVKHKPDKKTGQCSMLQASIEQFPGLNIEAPDLISTLPLVSGGSFALIWATSLGFHVLIGKRRELDGLKSFRCPSPRRRHLSLILSQ